MATPTPTQDVATLEDALRKLEADYSIPASNPFHTLLNEMFEKYRTTLGVDPGYQTGGGTDKTGS